MDRPVRLRSGSCSRTTLTAAAVAGPGYGDVVTFAVSTNESTRPFVNLKCYQGRGARRRGLGRVLRRSAGRPALRSVLAHVDRRRRRLHRSARHLRERPLQGARLDELPRHRVATHRNEEAPDRAGPLRVTGIHYRLRKVDTRPGVVGVGDVEALGVARAPAAPVGGVGRRGWVRHPPRVQSDGAVRGGGVERRDPVEVVVLFVPTSAVGRRPARRPSGSTPWLRCRWRS